MKTLTLEEYVTSVDDLLSRNLSIQDLVGEITEVKRTLLQNPGLIPDAFLDSSADTGYSRHLLHADPQGRYVVMALVWNPQATTPVHDHETWGVVGSYVNTLGVVEYATPDENSGLVESGSGSIGKGEVVGMTPPRRSNIHQMKNQGDARAISIHTYGDPGTVCRVYNPSNGDTKDKPLTFCNDS